MVFENGVLKEGLDLVRKWVCVQWLSLRKVALYLISESINQTVVAQTAKSSLVDALARNAVRWCRDGAMPIFLLLSRLHIRVDWPTAWVVALILALLVARCWLENVQ